MSDSDPIGAVLLLLFFGGLAIAVGWLGWQGVAKASIPLSRERSIRGFAARAIGIGCLLLAVGLILAFAWAIHWDPRSRGST